MLVVIKCKYSVKFFTSQILRLLTQCSTLELHFDFVISTDTPVEFLIVEHLEFPIFRSCLRFLTSQPQDYLGSACSCTNLKDTALHKMIRVEIISKSRYRLLRELTTASPWVELRIIYEAIYLVSYERYRFLIKNYQYYLTSFILLI